jgi:glycosyltransferase involved in cell wall biosynthesis
MKKALVLAHVASMIDLFNRDNINILTEMGYQVDVICNFKQGSVTSQFRVNQFRNELENAGIKTYHAPIPRSLLAVKELISSYFLIRKIVRVNHYKLVQCQSPIGGVIARLVCRKERKIGTKVIYIAHGFHFYKGAPLINWLLYYPIEKFCSRSTDCIITINREDYSLAANRMNNAKEIKYIPGVGIDVNKIKNIQVDINEQRNKLGIPIDSKVIVSVGELNKNKNHEVVIRAIAEIQRSDIYYIICGQGKLDNYLKNLAKKLKIDKRVIFLGYIENVYQINLISDIFTFPSIREGLSVSLMEAMACGLPIICSNIRGNNDLVVDGKGGLLIKTNDVLEFSNAIIKLIENNDLRYKMKEYNLSSIEEYSIIKINKLMKNAYEIL